MTVRVQLVVNPEAGGYSLEKLLALREAFRREGAGVTLAHVGPGRQLMIEDDAQLVVVAGGDGTLRHAAMALLASGRDLPLACFPMGTVNLLHLEVGGPTEPDQFAHVALNQVKAQFHVPATINGEMFFGCASVGPDAHAVAGVSLKLKSWIGRYAYLIAMLRMLGRWQRPQLTLVADGKTYKCEAVYVAKGVYFAGPYTFAPEARRTTAKLHVLALKQASRKDFWRFIRGVMRGRPLEDRANLIPLNCTTLDILSDEPWPVQADGDPVATLPVRVQISDQRLRLH
ncbi:MAG: diacylglycerol/lipid kinase family protein [Chakrabartia sp.]